MVSCSVATDDTQPDNDSGGNVYVTNDGSDGVNGVEDYVVIEDGFGDDNVADEDDAGCVGVDTDGVDNEDVGGDEFFAEDCGAGGAAELVVLRRAVMLSICCARSVLQHPRLAIQF